MSLKRKADDAYHRRPVPDSRCLEREYESCGAADRVERNRINIEPEFPASERKIDTRTDDQITFAGVHSVQLAIVKLDIQNLFNVEFDLLVATAQVVLGAA